MSSLRHSLIRGIADCAALARAGAAARAGFRILMYHSVGSAAEGDKLGIYGIAPELFAQHIAALAARENFGVVDLAHGLNATDRLRFAITFDDGYRDNLYAVAPVLQQHRIPFTVFVCPGFMRETTGNFLSRAELRELASLPGVTIGSHGLTHTPLTQLDNTALRNELVASKAELEDATGCAVSALSYPHGAVDRRVRDAAAAAGYMIGTCSRFDINHAARDPLLLCRTDIHSNDTLRIFKQKLHGDWDWYRWRNPDPALS